MIYLSFVRLCQAWEAQNRVKREQLHSNSQRSGTHTAPAAAVTKSKLSKQGAIDKKARKGIEQKQQQQKNLPLYYTLRKQVSQFVCDVLRDATAAAEALQYAAAATVQRGYRSVCSSVYMFYIY